MTHHPPPPPPLNHDESNLSRRLSSSDGVATQFSYDDDGLPGGFGPHDKYYGGVAGLSANASDSSAWASTAVLYNSSYPNAPPAVLALLDNAAAAAAGLAPRVEVVAAYNYLVPHGDGDDDNDDSKGCARAAAPPPTPPFRARPRRMWPSPTGALGPRARGLLLSARTKRDRGDDRGIIARWKDGQ